MLSVDRRGFHTCCWGRREVPLVGEQGEGRCTIFNEWQWAETREFARLPKFSERLDEVRIPQHWGLGATRRLRGHDR
jgi:hypothetical protein